MKHKFDPDCDCKLCQDVKDELGENSYELSTFF